MFFQFEQALSIADHPALPIEIAYAMRVYASAGAIQLRFPTMARELIFAAAYPARVAIPIDPASVRHRNGQSGRRIFERHKRRGFGRNWECDDDNADKQCKRKNLFHFVFPDVLPSGHRAARLCRADPRFCNDRCPVYSNIRRSGIENGERYAAERDRIKKRIAANVRALRQSFVSGNIVYFVH
jgi:hypothetical protein